MREFVKLFIKMIFYFVGGSALIVSVLRIQKKYFAGKLTHVNKTMSIYMIS